MADNLEAPVIQVKEWPAFFFSVMCFVCRKSRRDIHVIKYVVEAQSIGMENFY